MKKKSLSSISLLSLFLWNLALFLLTDCRKASSPKFAVEEATIEDIHRAIQSGELTCRQLVEYYLTRIEAYDQPLNLNSIVVVNPDALKKADELDKEFTSTRKLRPLHGIPVIVKDNYDTKDLQTAAGSLALKGSKPPDDAYQVRKIREAGAIVLAKSNMAEWAFSPYQTVSSVAGTTRNPYDLERVPAGSSGGTAAAVAANLGAVGLGTDTGNSIRGPSSHNCLVGIRSTMGLTSRDGIVPLYLRNDIGGPMARTVEDAVRVLEVIAGYDPADPITKNCTDIMLKVNIGVDELKEFYFKAKIFWHLCGLDQTDPALVEHFGMTIVEAMQNKIVPLVFDGGGQKEIVDHLINGYRVNKTSELISFTVDLIKNPQQANKMAQAACIKSKRFSAQNFRKGVRDFFQQVILKYKSDGSENEI